MTNEDYLFAWSVEDSVGKMTVIEKKEFLKQLNEWENTIAK